MSKHDNSSAEQKVTADDYLDWEPDALRRVLAEMTNAETRLVLAFREAGYVGDNLVDGVEHLRALFDSARASRETAKSHVVSLHSNAIPPCQCKGHPTRCYNHPTDCGCTDAETQKAGVITRVFMLCNAYESGYGHGLAGDELVNPYSPGGEEHEAYQTGVQAGYEASKRSVAEKASPPPVTARAPRPGEIDEYMHAAHAESLREPTAPPSDGELHALRMALAATPPTNGRVCDNELQIISEHGQPHGIRDKGGYLFFFPRVSKYSDQEQRYRDELAELFRLADYLLDCLKRAVEPTAPPPTVKESLTVQSPGTVEALVANQRPLDADFQKVVNDKFFELLSDEPTAPPSKDYSGLVAEINGAISLSNTNWSQAYAVTQFVRLLRECQIALTALQPVEPAAAPTTGLWQLLDEFTDRLASDRTFTPSRGEIVELLRLLLDRTAPPNDDASLNAPWLSLAHATCADAGIPPGHIYERMKALGDRVWAWRNYKQLHHAMITANGAVSPVEPGDSNEP